MNILATKPGSPPAKVEKRTYDSRVYSVDCDPLLSKGEVIFGAPDYNSKAPLEITDARTKGGRYLEFRATGGPTNVPFVDTTISFELKTSNASTIVVPVTIRTYSE